MAFSRFFGKRSQPKLRRCRIRHWKDFGHPLANAVNAGDFEFGISICGTGNGINMVVNKHPGIRAALCWNEEICRLSRAHNDANILTLPGWFISESEAYLIVRTFLTTEFEGGRHMRRVDKISLKTVSYTHLRAHETP